DFLQESFCFNKLTCECYECKFFIINPFFAYHIHHHHHPTTIIGVSADLRTFLVTLPDIILSRPCFPELPITTRSTSSSSMTSRMTSAGLPSSIRVSRLQPPCGLPSAWT